MARRARHREVEIFNFSFLDILACTIGLLIFIMVMVFVLQADSVVADVSSVISRKQEQLRSTRLNTDQDAAMARQLEEQLERLQPAVDPRLVAERTSLRAAVDSARAAYQQESQAVQRAQDLLDSQREARKRELDARIRDAEARLLKSQVQFVQAQNDLAAASTTRPSTHVRFLPGKRPGEEVGSYNILHVDCRANQVVLLRVAADGSVSPVGSTPAHGLDDDNSEFARSVRHQLVETNPLVLFWVRPDGLEAFEEAMHALPKEMPRGFEPAEANWEFSSVGK